MFEKMVQKIRIVDCLKILDIKGENYKVIEESRVTTKALLFFFFKGENGIPDGSENKNCGLFQRF